MYSGQESALEMNTGISQKLEEIWVGKETEKEWNRNEITEKKETGYTTTMKCKERHLKWKVYEMSKMKITQRGN